MSVRDRALRAALKIYKLTLSPAFMAFGTRCRFTPTCSEYATEAVIRHGWLRGCALASGRLLRCRPGGGCGHDPVPEKNAKDARAHA